jgi:hypothetical protein
MFIANETEPNLLRSVRSETFLMPQRGYGLQPRVAVSATLGTGKERNFNRIAVASFSPRESTATAMRLRTRSFF